MKVSIVILLALRLASCFSSSVYVMTVLIACISFSFENVVFEQSLCSIIFSNRYVYCSSFWMEMQARSYITSSFQNISTTFEFDEIYRHSMCN